MRLALKIIARRKTINKRRCFMVTCQGCKKSVDYARQPEVSMGAVKCPHCGAIIDQSGKVLRAAGR
jgi:rRNA maturation endonuclease Nob1